MHLTIDEETQVLAAVILAIEAIEKSENAKTPEVVNCRPGHVRRLFPRPG